MRLSEKVREIINAEVANQLGGDIDLLVEPKRPLEHRIQAECKLAARLFIRLGGRKVDVLIKV